MKRAIVIGTHWGGREALDVLLHSLEGVNYPIHIVVHGDYPEEILTELGWFWTVHHNPIPGFELGCFRTILEETDIDEFLFLQDTFEVIDPMFIDAVFALSTSVALGPLFFHYAGKWKRSVLLTLDIPIVRTKEDSIYWEHVFPGQYEERERVFVFDPNFRDEQNKGFVEKYGRLNMLLENQWYRKLKGTYR